MAKVVDTREAFEAFVLLLRTHEEGVFFSHQNAAGERQWHCGVGKAERVNFDHPEFPVFCATDFLGEQNIAWKFDYQKSGTQEAPKFPYATRLPKVKKKKFTLKAQTEETEISFMEKIKDIQQFQREGNAWVLNLAHQFEGKFEADEDAFDVAVEIFGRFLKHKKPHNGGFIWTDELKAISLSPETFLVQESDHLQTFPIKGTGTKESLQENEKEQAELQMITDLMRNDLGQICTAVKVLQERVLEDQKDFYHSYSVIEGTLKDKKLTWEAYKKLLPAGSISGAPKKRVVEKIIETESFQRNFYTGTFGVRLSPEYSLWGILIRTMFFEDKHWKLPVGAGITVDSNPQQEWHETLQKAKSCLNL